MKTRVNSIVRIAQRLDCKTIQLLISTRKRVNSRANTEAKHDSNTPVPRIKTRKKVSNLSPKHKTERILKIKLPKSCRKKFLSVTTLAKLRMKLT